MKAAPGAAAAAVMPGVLSTPGLPRGGDARGAARAAATGSIFGYEVCTTLSTTSAPNTSLDDIFM